MIKFFLITVSLFFSFESFSKSVSMNVFVHGTYPAKKVLEHDYSPFKRLIYTEPGFVLAKKLPKKYHFHKVAVSCDNYDADAYSLDHFFIFGWHSNNLRPEHRSQEGRKLYDAVSKQIESYREQGYDQISLRFIGSSHGGNVILNALQWLPFAESDIDIEVIFMGLPVQEETRNYINNPHVARAYSFYSTSDWIQKMDIQRLHKNCPKGAPFFSQRTFLSTDKIVQIQLTVDGKSFSHWYYRQLYGYLPLLMQQVKATASLSDTGHIVMNFDKP